jgi:hypothetical protein
MAIVSPDPRIASAYVVLFGHYGDVTRHARQRQVSRQWLYRQAAQLTTALEQQQTQLQQLRQQVLELTQRLHQLHQRLQQAVVLDDDLQAQFASVAQARGISLLDCRELLEVLLPGRVLSVATLGRRTQAAARQAGLLLPVLDDCARQKVRDAAADEIYVRSPVRMVVEQHSLCWVSGRLAESVDGDGWYQEFRQLPRLEQLARDGGNGLKKGVALVNADRQQDHQPLVVDQGDHFHALRPGGVGLRKAQQRASRALAAAEQAEKEWQAVHRRGDKKWEGHCQRARRAWEKAEQLMDEWVELERTWEQTKGALRLITPAGTLNSRAQAEAVLAQTLPRLPEADFAKVQAALQKPEMLSYLDRVERQIAELPFAPEVQEAAVQQECSGRSPALLRGPTAAAAARRGMLLVCGVVLSQAAGGVGSQVVAAVREILGRAYRASSLVECINSVLRMQQARHRKLTQGLLDLKRLYWNSHTFRTGRRRGQTPYQLLGVSWPEGMTWWQVLKLSPEQLRDKLSTAKLAA